MDDLATERPDTGEVTMLSQNNSDNLAPVVLRVIGDSVAVEVISHTTRVETDGGIYVPEGSRETPETQQGRVFCVGCGMRNVINGNPCGMDVKAGEIVIFPMHIGFEIKVRGRKFVVIKEGDVIACL